MQTPKNTAANSAVPEDMPSWLLEKGPDRPAGAPHAGTGYIAKTLRRFSGVFENEFFCERYAAMPMLLQGIDPRAKLLVLLGFVLFSAFCSSIAVLLALSVVALIYAKLSGLDMAGFVRRAWVYIPVIVFLFSIPGASSLFTKGPPLFYILRPGASGFPAGLYFSAAGIGMAFRLALRPGVSLSFVFLLLLTTRWNRLTGALSRLRVPSVAVSVLNMAYRYLFIMTQTGGHMMQARYLRTVGRLRAGDNRRFMSRSAAQLFIKSHFFSEEVYGAMVCRGFTGSPVGIERFAFGLPDLLFVVSNCMILLILGIGERLF